MSILIPLFLISFRHSKVMSLAELDRFVQSVEELQPQDACMQVQIHSCEALSFFRHCLVFDVKKRTSKQLAHLSQNEFVLYIGVVWNGKLACYILQTKYILGLFVAHLDRSVRGLDGNHGKREKAIGL